MNPPKNRILVSSSSDKDINESSIMNFIVWSSGNWFYDIDSLNK